MADWTKEKIIELLRTNDRAVARALVRINENQTYDEQRDSTTKYDNSMGFRPCHAAKGTSMARFYLRTGKLSEKQVNWWRVKGKDGNMRIGIYANQLLTFFVEKTG